MTSGEKVRIWKENIVVYFTTLSRHLSVDNELKNSRDSDQAPSPPKIQA